MSKPRVHSVGIAPKVTVPEITASGETALGVTASDVTASDVTASDVTASEVTDREISSPDVIASGRVASGAGVFGSGVPPMVDAFEFARRGQVVAGAFAIQRLGRLLDGLPEQPVLDLPKTPGMPGHPGVVVYRVQGEVRQNGKSYLSVLVQALIVLDCQRCLGPLVLPVDHAAEFELARRESDLEADATELDEDDLDQPEKVVGSRRFDLVGLIEDELILEVPFIPRHVQCPGEGGELSGPRNDEPATERESPFAALGSLKSKRQ